jgi:hypothetical protein
MLILFPRLLLFPCLSFKQNNDLNSSQEIIPFRESKLTHLLMPILNRAGLSGTAMIACVNPQIDDYDETISILSNASLASKIKEISDVGRTASQQMSNAAITAANAAAVAAAAATVAAANAAAALNQQKRRRVENGGTSTGSAGTLLSRTSSSSGAALVRPRPISKHGHGAATAAAGALKRKASSETVEEVAAADCMDVDAASVSDEPGTELKRLRVEVTSLRELNASLAYEQLNRETEIRIEVAEEMALRSNHLLEQIQSLQNQLSEVQSSSSTVMTDLTKSVKKQRKRQMRTIEQDHAQRDVQEVEEEMERMKAGYEKEISILKSQNFALTNAVKKLQIAASSSSQPAGIPPPSLSAAIVSKFNNVFGAASSSSKPPSNSSNTVQIQENIENSSSAAAEFSKRFASSSSNNNNAANAKKNDENSGIPVAMDVSGMKKSPLSKSPLSQSRSPLSEMKNANNNSPVQPCGAQSPRCGGGNSVVKSYQANTVSHSAKRVDSPQRVRDENTAPSSSAAASGQSQGYSTRLRTQVIRA